VRTGGMGVRYEWWWQWGSAFTKPRRGVGLGPKAKTSRIGRFGERRVKRNAGTVRRVGVASCEGGGWGVAVRET